jgi:hypothetical protein
MNQIVLQPSALSQWYALINEAEVHSRCRINEDMESYLVYLLMRFSREVKWATDVVGLDFLNALQVGGKRSADLLKEVGDKSLLFCGLFPGVANKRHVSLHYFMDMGRGAYWQVGNLETPQTGTLFHALCREFGALQKVLDATRHLTSDLSNLIENRVVCFFFGTVKFI